MTTFFFTAKETIEILFSLPFLSLVITFADKIFPPFSERNVAGFFLY